VADVEVVLGEDFVEGIHGGEAEAVSMWSFLLLRNFGNVRADPEESILVLVPKCFQR
jgi:hypothetical protein